MFIESALEPHVDGKINLCVISEENGVKKWGVKEWIYFLQGIVQVDVRLSFAKHFHRNYALASVAAGFRDKELAVFAVIWTKHWIL